MIPAPPAGVRAWNLQFAANDQKNVYKTLKVQGKPHVKSYIITGINTV